MRVINQQWDIDPIQKEKQHTQPPPPPPPPPTHTPKTKKKTKKKKKTTKNKQKPQQLDRNYYGSNEAFTSLPYNVFLILPLLS